LRLKMRLEGWDRRSQPCVAGTSDKPAWLRRISLFAFYSFCTLSGTFCEGVWSDRVYPRTPVVLLTPAEVVTEVVRMSELLEKPGLRLKYPWLMGL
jgi:hypothetical protein